MKIHDLRPAPGSSPARPGSGAASRPARARPRAAAPRARRSRAGASIPAWFEGGQTPLHIRIPKLRGFKNINGIEYQVVNVGRISARVEAGQAREARRRPVTVNADTLKQAGPHQPRPPAAQDPGQRRGLGEAVRARGRVHRRAPARRSRPPAARPRSSSPRAAAARGPGRRAGRGAEAGQAGGRRPPPAKAGAEGRGRARGHGTGGPSRGASRPSADEPRPLPTEEASEADAPDAARLADPCSTPSSTRSVRRTSGAGSCSSPGSCWSSGCWRTCRCRASTATRSRSFLERAARSFSLLDLFSRRRADDLLDHRAGREPVHQRLDHHAADDRGGAPLQQLQREGEYGRNKINQYTRYLTVPMALLQAYGFLALLSATSGVLITTSTSASFETIDPDRHADRGLRGPHVAGRADHRAGHRQRHQLHHLRGHRQPGPGGLATFLGSPDLAAGRRCSPSWASSRSRRSSTSRKASAASRSSTRAASAAGACTRAAQTFLPLRVNQAGVIPIIFAVSILLFPASWRATSGVAEGVIRDIVARRSSTCSSQGSLLYIDPVLPADGRLHVLLHGVHVQARRDGRPAAQERRLHPGHPARGARRGTTSPGS